jgi:hypothetical protein
MAMDGSERRATPAGRDPARLPGDEIGAWLAGRYGPDFARLFAGAARERDGRDPARRHCFLAATANVLGPARLSARRGAVGPPPTGDPTAFLARRAERRS